jgi:hypothetical protein
MDLTKLKPLVNNPIIWKQFEEYVEKHEKQALANMLHTPDTTQLWRAQGFLAALKVMKDLKDKVNAE